MQTKKNRAVVLINLGTPDDPKPESVGRYLKEFLMDPYVIDIPKPIRWFLVNQIIVPKRKFASAELYQKIWMKEGSPLLVHTQNLGKKLQTKLNTAEQSMQVFVAMRYANPSIESVLRSIETKFDEIIFIPLYPQFAEASTESTRKKIQEIINPKQNYKFIESFYDSPKYIQSWAEQTLKITEGKKIDHFIFSFHGLPERQLTKLSKGECEFSNDCCDQLKVKNCYRAQCFQSAKLIAQKMNLSKDRYTVAFQSRLGRTKWITPYTDEVIKHFPQKSIAVLSPSFVCDCLETLEEIAIRLKEQFIETAQGKDFTFIPCLNDSDSMVDVLEDIVKENI